jgi:hypothetical protein
VLDSKYENECYLGYTNKIKWDVLYWFSRRCKCSKLETRADFFDFIESRDWNMSMSYSLDFHIFFTV